MNATLPICGIVRPGYERVAAEFQENFRHRGDSSGAAFTAVVQGETVVDLYGGWANGGKSIPWHTDTIVGIFSGTKGFVAICLLLLLERGQLELERPVSAYWPEFAAQGKERTLVKHLVSHQAGLPGLMTAVTPEAATDHVRMAALLATQEPICEPGTQLHYHALTFGWLCGELIRRVDGRSVGQMFAQDVAQRLGLDAWIGLPADQEPRVALLVRGPGFGAPKPGGATTDRLAWSIWDNPPRFSSDPLPANCRYWRAAEVPASNGVASARAVARLYSCLANGGEIEGVRLLLPQTIASATRCLARGVEPFLKRDMAYGVGFQLQTESALFGKPLIAFGHDGAGGSMHGAWPALKVGFAYVTNTLIETEGRDPRSTALLDTLHDCLAARNG